MAELNKILMFIPYNKIIYVGFSEDCPEDDKQFKEKFYAHDRSNVIIKNYLEPPYKNIDHILNLNGITVVVKK